MLIFRQIFVAALRILLVGACALGAWSSWAIARADYLFRQNTVSSIRASLQWAPDNPAAYMRLARLDESKARQMLDTALRLDPYNAQANIELGLLKEANGETDAAEKLLLHAFEIDRTYTPRWSLANFYLRQGNLPAFWLWAHRAAEMPPDDMGALFALCWRVAPDPNTIADAILNNNPSTVRQFIVFLLAKNQLDAAVGLATHLLQIGEPDRDRALLLSLVNQAIAANDVKASTEIWRGLVQKKWIVADVSVPNNPDFSRDPLPVGFDWTLSSQTGLHSWPGPAGLAVELSGDQPESCTIAEQALALVPSNYTFHYSYRTTDIAPDTGITWQILDAKSGSILAESSSLSSDVMLGKTLNFTVPQGTSLLRLRLGYRRALGTTRVRGTLTIQSTIIRQIASPQY